MDMKPFWILGHPRCGSHLLSDHLNQTKHVRPVVDEWLNMLQNTLPIPKWKPWWVPFQNFELDYNVLINNLPPFASVHWPHYSNFFTLEDKPAIERNLPGIRYVQLRRRDVVATTVSRYIAQNTRVWVLESEEQRKKHSDAKISINERELLRSYHYTKTMFGVWDKYLEGSDFLEVIYEEMIADLQSTLERVFEYLEIPTQPNASNTRVYKTDHPLRKQLYEMLEESIASGEINKFKAATKHTLQVPLL